MKTIIKVLLYVLTLLLLNQCEKSEPTITPDFLIEWLTCYGGSDIDIYESIIQTSDGGYLVNGTTKSNDGDITINYGDNDGWIIKLDAQGIIEWQKYYGGDYYDHITSVNQTSDGGFIAAGWTFSTTCDVCNAEAWILKLNQDGEIEWENFYGGSDKDYCSSIIQLDDEGYLAVGSTYSNDGDVSGNHGEVDGWIIKLDQEGIIEWQKCYGGSASDYSSSIIQIQGESFIVTGMTESMDGDISGNHGERDIWIIKLDEEGTIVWQKCYGGGGIDWHSSTIQTSDDGGYMITGWTSSNDEDVTCNHGENDGWIIKLNQEGTIEWTKCYGGNNSDAIESLIQNSDSGYIAAGGTYSNEGDVSGNHGGQDGWILKMDNTGNVEWQKCIGGSEWDRLISIIQIMDNGYIASGRTSSNDGDITGNTGNQDFWIMKIILKDQ